MGINAISGVIYGGNMIMDISNTTATPETVFEGYNFYGADGNFYTGTASGGGGTSNDLSEGMIFLGGTYIKGGIPIISEVKGTDFNESVTIGKNVISCKGMFSNCYNYNQQIVIPNDVISYENMFANCYEFDQSINLYDSNVQSYASMFCNCKNLNYFYYTGPQITNCRSMFLGCTNLKGSIYFNRSSKIKDVAFLVKGHDPSNRLNIYINNNSTIIDLFTNTSSQGSIVGQSISWTISGYNPRYYNGTFNLWIYVI